MTQPNESNPTADTTDSQAAENAQPQTFEQALEKLEAIVAEIEEGRVSLEESIDRYAEGTTLVKRCRKILDEAEKKIQLLAKGDDDELLAAGELEDDEA
jgi:exodeoxyribonuclease VII small subunit